MHLDGTLNETLRHLNAKQLHISPPYRVQSAKPGPLELQAKRVLVVFVETTDPLENRESEDQQDHLAAQETKETLAKTDQR